MKKTFFYLIFFPFLSFSQASLGEDQKTLSEENYSITFNSDYKYNNFSGYRNGLNVVYNHNKWKVNTSFSYGKIKDFWHSDVSTFYPNLSFIGTRTSYFNALSLLSYIDVQYEISEKTKLSIFSKNEWEQSEMDIDNQIDIFDNQSELEKRYIGFGTYDLDYRQNSVNFLLQHHFNKKNQVLIIEGDKFNRTSIGNPTVKGQDYDSNGIEIPDRLYDTYTDIGVAIDIYSLNASMSIPLKWFDFSVGGKWTFVDADYKSKNFLKEDFDYNEVLSLSPISNYIENRQSVFTEFRKKIKKWNFTAGLKFERSLIKGFVTDVDTENIYDTYGNLLPSLNIRYSLNENSQITFNYGKSLNRPIFRFINPAIGIYNAYENYTGNPFLTPSFSDNFNLSYSFKSNGNLSFSYVKTKNHIGALSKFSNDNIESHNILNYLDLNTYQVTLNKNLKLLNFIDNDIQLQAFYKFNESLVPTIKDGDILGWYLNTNNSINLNKSKTISSFINFWYMSKTIDSEYIYKERYSLNLGIKFSLLEEKNLIIEANVNDVFRSEIAYVESVIDNIRQDYRNYWQPRHFKISVSYKFGNKKLKYSERNSTNFDDQYR